jgi:hypothetical protein
MIQMAANFEDFQKFSKEQLEAAASTSSSLTKNFQTIAAEAAEYSKKSMETHTAYLEKLLGAKTFESAVQIQSEYFKTSYASLIAQATKIGELYANVAKEALKPIELAVAKAKLPNE